MSTSSNSSKGFGFSSVLLFALTLIIIFVAVYLMPNGFSNQGKDNWKGTSGLTQSDKEFGTLMNIQKVGRVEIKEARTELRTGEEVFSLQCASCHKDGLVGAPKFSIASEWAARIPAGYEALLNSALHGKGQMGAQGGGAFEDIEIGRAVVYMANAGGANFDEPQPEKAEGDEAAAEGEGAA